MHRVYYLNYLQLLEDYFQKFYEGLGLAQISASIFLEIHKHSKATAHDFVELTDPPIAICTDEIVG